MSKKKQKKQPQLASPMDLSEFHSRIEQLLAGYQERLQRMLDVGYELRTTTVRRHKVRAHTRLAYRRVYLARKVGT